MLLSPGQARRLFEHATTRRYAVLAVNADSPAAVTDCLMAARECDAPVIVETSLWQLTGHIFGAGDPYLGLDRYLAEIAVLTASERFADVPVVFHTDHIKGPETPALLKHAMRAGASSISLDSSELSHAENIDTLCELCAFAGGHGLGATLEMEAGVDDGLTPVGEAHELFGAVEERHPGYLALWAPGVGTRHGLHGDSGGFSAEVVREHQSVVSELAGRPIGIALHGSSGLSDGQLRAAVEAGVAKVNWSSESLLLRSSAARRFYAEHGEHLDKGHPEFKATAMDNAVQAFVSAEYVPRVAGRMRVLGGESMASEFLGAWGGRT